MQIKTFFTRTPLINILVFGLGFLLLIAHIFKKRETHVEAFTQEEKFVTKYNNDLYDPFYVDVYEYVMNDPMKISYELGKIEKNVKIGKSSNILDIGSGLGYHVDSLHHRGIPIIGLESSRAMIAKSKDKFDDIDVKYGNAMDSMIFEGNEFTHIFCLFYTFYYMPDQEAFLRNCYKWLRHNGHLVVHVVDRERFHPIVPPSEVYAVPMQTFAKKGERITESIVKFEGFDYKSKFTENFKEGNKAKFLEEFTDKNNGNVRKNVHSLEMLSISDTEKLFKHCGFKINKIENLTHIRYHYQYLYFLQKS
tara:strand:+ start:21 stop:941 length:921 start_codon:yes stop_codon:yes gene_type:complete